MTVNFDQLQIIDSKFSFSLSLSNWKRTTEKNKRTDVPDKYFLVTNNEIVRIRYLIVYGTDVKNSERANLASCNSDYQGNTIVQWAHRHKWLVAMIIYTIILAILGTSNSRHGHYMRQFVRETMLKAINYVKTLQFVGFELLQQLFD